MAYLTNHGNAHTAADRYVVTHHACDHRCRAERVDLFACYAWPSRVTDAAICQPR